MAAPSTDDEVQLLVQAIRRISGGGTTVTFGTLARDEAVTQTFEALLGTLKAARKRGLLNFQGELLLMGQHDKTEISLASDDGGEPTAATAAAPAPAPALLPNSVPAPEVVLDTPVANPPAPAEAAAPAPAQDPELKPAPPTETIQAAKPAPAPVPAAAPGPAAPQMPQAGPGSGEEDADSMARTLSNKGKWNVDTSYIDYRTADPNRLESRRSLVEGMDMTEPGAGLAPNATMKDSEGKWMQVNVSYINHRTSEVDRLEGRRTSALGGEVPVPAAPPSATVKKEGDGKWKVDTSYIGYRTGDPNNIRKEGSSLDPKYASPEEKKYAYSDLKGVASRPPEVDPTQKEQYLADAEFKDIFGMGLAEFLGLPKWKQQNLKKAKDLF